MLAADHRLRESDAFRRTVRSGRRASNGALVVHVLVPGGDGGGESREAAPARVGFVVSKAVGGAVVRNRVRRRLRHLVADRVAQLPPGTELVVRALPGAARSPSAELEAELARCLDRALRVRTGASSS